MTLAAPGRFRATRRVDVKLELLPSAAKLKSRAAVHFHSGSFETTAAVDLLGRPELAAGEGSFAQLKLNASVLLLPGDRFIIRQSSPLSTIGGGMVLDPIPRRPRRQEAPRERFLEAVAGNDRGEILAQLVERAPFGLLQKEIPARTGWTDGEVAHTVRELAGAARIRVIAPDLPVLYMAPAFDVLETRIAERVDRFHSEHPLEPGMAREDLRNAVARRLRPEIFRAALDELASRKKLELAGERVKRAGAGISLRPEETAAKEQIEAAFASAGLAVPAVREVLAKLAIEAQRSEKLLQLLLREKALVRVSGELIFHREALALLRPKLAAYKAAKGERISVPAFKELTGVTRKYAIPLLEYLDRERVTRRQGDERVIL